MLRSIGAIAIAAVALSGCVRTTVDTTISADDTFSQHAVVAFSDEIAEQIGGEAGMDIGAMFDDIEGSPELEALEEQYPGKVLVEPYDDGELQGVEITLTDLPLEEFNTAAQQTASGVGGAATLNRVDDQFILEVETPDGTDLDSLGITESQLGLLGSSVDISVSYTFPGLVEEATVGEIEGNTVTLGLADMLGGEGARIVAGATDEMDWGPVLRWGGIALALILVVGGAIALIVQDRRKHRQSTLPPPVTTTDPHGPGMLGETPSGDAPAAGDDRIGRTEQTDGEEPGRST